MSCSSPSLCTSLLPSSCAKGFKYISECMRVCERTFGLLRACVFEKLGTSRRVRTGHFA